MNAGKEGKSILDLGCGLGQDLRQLCVESGAVAKLYATDADQKVWDLGLEMFGDGEKPVAKFFCADARKQNFGGKLDEIIGTVDVVITSQLLDLFWFHGQLEVLENVVRLSKVGTKVMDCTLGTADGEVLEYESDGYGPFSRFYHSRYSLEIPWIDVAARTNTKWRVEAAHAGSGSPQALLRSAQPIDVSHQKSSTFNEGLERTPLHLAKGSEICHLCTLVLGKIIPPLARTHKGILHGE